MRSAAGAHSLGREFFVDQELFAREQANIFARSWLLLGRSSDWERANSFATMEIGGQPVVVVRSADGILRGFHNVCRHRGATVVDGEKGCLEKGLMTCPYHAWSYDLTGQLIGAPNMASVENFQRANYRLQPFHIQTAHGFVFGNLSDQPPELASALKTVESHLKDWGVAELALGARLEYQVRANWKLLFENYSECYHCPTVHPALNRLTPYKGSDNESQDGPILGGPMNLADGIATMSTTGKLAGCPIPGLDSKQLRSVYYFTVFPSFFFSFHPDYLLIHRLEPQRVDATRVICEFLFHPAVLSDASFDPSGAVEFWDMTNRQDWEVCERVQSGARSTAFAPGPLSNLESIVAAFDRHYRKVMKV